MTSLGVELKLPARVLARRSASNSPALQSAGAPASGSREHSSGSGSGSSVSRVRVHAGTPELSITLPTEHKEVDESKDDARMGTLHLPPPSAMQSPPYSPCGGGGGDTSGGEDGPNERGKLTHDTDNRSAKSTRLLRELDAQLVGEEILASPKLKPAVLKHYLAQNELVEGFKSIVHLEEAETAAEREQKEAAMQQQSGAVKFAIEASLALTLLFIVLKFFAAIWSASMAVIASAVDSALDVLSQGTLVFTSRFMRKRDPVAYPIGKSRVENLSVLVFGVIMGLAAVFLLYQSVLVLVNGFSSRPEIRIDAVTISMLGFTIIVQAGMYFYCKAVAAKGGPNSGAVEAIGQDQGNDVCCNSIGLASALIAAYQNQVWFMDSIGGILISIYIFSRWASVCLEHFTLLLGQSASPQFLNRLTFLALTHDQRIRKVDTVLAYRLGAKYHVEVHVVLPGEMPLREAHDIGEALEQNIEKIEDVELAWVHLDFEWSHVAEHNRWKL